MVQYMYIPFSVPFRTAHSQSLMHERNVIMVKYGLYHILCAISFEQLIANH
jgi:hypothetical protein